MDNQVWFRVSDYSGKEQILCFKHAVQYAIKGEDIGAFSEEYQDSCANINYCRECLSDDFRIT